MSQKNLCVFISLIIFLIFFSSCDTFNRAVNQLDDLEKVFNEKTGDLSAELKNWREKLPKSVHDIIDDDIETLSRNIIGATGAETKCSIDFLRKRFAQSVENIKLKLLHRPLINERPCFCTLSLPMVNPNADSKFIQSLIFYGYDFFSEDSSNKLMKVVLVGQEKSKQISEEYIGRTSNYQLVVNLTDLLPEIATNKYQKIKIFWNGDSTNFSEAVISKWKPDIKFDNFQPRTFSWYPPHTGGDNDLNTKDGNWATGQVQLEMRVHDNNIEGRLFYDVMEFGGDNTRFGVNGNGEASAWGPWTTLYTNNDLNYDLTGFSPTAPPRYPFSTTNQDIKYFHQGGTAVEQFEAYIDRKGDDAGYCHVEVLFNPMQAILIQKQPVQK